MYTEMFEKVLGQVPAAPETMIKFNKLGVAMCEKLVHLQLDAYKAAAELTLEQMKTVAEINDTESLMAFWQNQGKVVNSVREQQEGFVKALTSLGNELNEELQQVTTTVVKQAA